MRRKGCVIYMEFSKLSAPSLKDLFVQQLQGMILSGELPMGAQLPPERELARQMQVSRAVVNGGLAELAQQGFLEVRPRQGTCVADYRRKGNLGTLIAIMEYQGGVLGKDEIRSILEVRRALEHLAAERAIRYASDEALSQLGEIVARLKDAANATQAAEIAFTFQHELALSGGNSILPLIYYSFKAPVITLWVRFAGFMALKLCITTRKRCIAAFAPAMNRLRRSGSTPIWSKPLMGISRFMRNGKQRPTLWVENEKSHIRHKVAPYCQSNDAFSLAVE